MSEKRDIQKTKPSVLTAMASKYNVDQRRLLDTLKDTAFKGATDAQMIALCVVANEYKLNPFTKEIYAFPDKKGGGIIPVIGADGWYRIVNDNPQFDGADFSEAVDENGKVESITCRIHRKDRGHPVTVTEHLSECKRNTEPWNNQPRRMLRHRAFIQCARIAFGLSVADPEDAERAQDYHKRESREVKSDTDPFEEALNQPALPTDEDPDMEWDAESEEVENQPA